MTTRKTSKKTAKKRTSSKASNPKKGTTKKKTRTKKEGNVISVNTDETKLEEVNEKLKSYLSSIEDKLNSSVLNIDSHLIQFPSTYVFNNSSSVMNVSDDNINSAKFQKSDNFRQIVVLENVTEELFDKLYECKEEEIPSLINLTIIPMIQSLYSNAGHDHNTYSVGYYFGKFKAVGSDNYIEKLSDGTGYKIVLSSFCSPLDQVKL